MEPQNKQNALGLKEKAELVYGCFAWYFELGTDLVALVFLPRGLMVANASAIVAAYCFTLFLYSQRGDPRQFCMATMGLHIFYDTFCWSFGDGRKHPSLFMMEFVDAVFRSPFSLFLQLTAIFDGEEGGATAVLLVSTFSSLVQEAKAQSEIENCEHLFRGQIETLMSKKAFVITLTRTVEIVARQLVLAFVQSASKWLGIVAIAGSAVVMSLLTFLDPDSMPSSALVNFFVLPFVNVRGWTTDIGWKPVGLPRCFFYSTRLVENVLLCAVTIAFWREAALDIWNRWWVLGVVGIVCNVILLPMVFVTTRLVSRDPNWVHPSARQAADVQTASDAKAGPTADTTDTTQVAPTQESAV